MSRELTESILTLYPERPKVALLMSGSGTNAVNLLGHPAVRDLYDITVIVTDNQASNAATIASEHNLPLLERHVDRFTSPTERADYFDSLSTELGERGIQAAFYAGFMKITTNEFCRRFPGVNVHPADLRLIGDDELPRFRGMDALSQMRRALGYVRSTAHVVDVPVDSGTALAVSDIVLPTTDTMTDADLHGALKIQEHYLFPETLRRLATRQLDPLRHVQHIAHPNGVQHG